MGDDAEKGEKAPLANMGKENMFLAVSELLKRGYAISNTEIFELAESYGVNRGSAPGTLNTRAAQAVMDEAGVMPIRKDHHGRKIWIDGRGRTRSDEIRKTERIMTERRRKKP